MHQFRGLSGALSLLAVFVLALLIATAGIAGTVAADGIDEGSGTNLYGIDRTSDADPASALYAWTTESEPSNFHVLESVQTAAILNYSNPAVSVGPIFSGSTVDGTVTVENTGDADGTYNVSLSVDGTVEQWANGTISTGETTTVTITETLWNDGDRSVTVSGGDASASETVTVERAMATYHGGPDRLGHYPDVAGPTSQPVEVWNVTDGTPHAMQSTIVDGTLYTAFHDFGKLYALDAATGEEYWNATPGGTSGSTWTTPAYADGVLYLGSNDYKLHAIDATDGTELWHYSTQTNVRSAPAVVDDVVYFGSNDGNMTALNATSGEELWHHTLYQPILVESNPAIVDGVVYFGANDKNVTALDAETGSEIWQFETPQGVQSDPTVADGTVYIGSDNGTTSAGNGKIYAIDAIDGTERWNYTMTGHVDAGLVYADGIVYGGSRGGDFVALDATDGSLVWDYVGSDFYGAPVVAGGVVYVSDFANATVHAFDAATGSKLWWYDSPTDNLFGTPLVWDGQLYYGTGTHLYAIAQPAPTISNVKATNPDAQDVQVSFESDTQLVDISVSISGAEAATLTESDFSESGSGPYTYTAIYAGSTDGEYTVTVETATDADGVDGANGESDSVVVDTVSPTLSNLDATNPSSQDVMVSLDADEQLATLDVSITGAEIGSLVISDFTETDNGDGSYTYTGTYAASTDGDYTVTVETAADSSGNDGASGESVSVSVELFPITENFDGSEPADWEIRHDASWGDTHDGESTLHLTTASGDEKGVAFYDQSFGSTAGIVAEFSYYAAEGDGADGLAFFLVDGDQVDAGTSSIIGASGSSLGYAQGDTSGDGSIDSPDEEGVPHAYLGVGFDEFGRFAADVDCKDGGDTHATPSPSDDVPDSVTIRASGNGGACDIGYRHLITTDVGAQGGIDGGWRLARVTVIPTDTDADGTPEDTDLRVEMSWDDGNSWTTVTRYIYAETPPEQLKLGFSGSTGGSTNVHAIDDLSIRQPVDLQTTVTSAPTADPYHAGETVEYAVTVTNNGPNDDSSITLGPTVVTGPSGLENVQWDTDGDGAFDDDTGASATISLPSGDSQLVQLRGTVGSDATGNLDHDMTAATSSKFNDPDPSNNDASVAVTLNTPPEFANDESLAAIDEDVDDAGNGGDQIDSNELFGDEFSDADGDGFAGIVVTDDAANSTTEGSWQYSTDGGTTWYDVDDGSLSSSNGLLLDRTTVVRFDPVADYNGDPGTLTVFAVDDSGSTTFTSGSMRRGYDTTNDGRSSVAAATGNTAGISVQPVNDAPVFDDSTPSVTVNENDTASLDENLSATDVDTDDTLTWTVSSPPSNGTLSGFPTADTSTGESVTPTGLTYEPPENYTSADSFEVEVDDGQGGTDNVTVSVTIADVTPPNADANNSDTTGEEGSPIQFDGTASTDNADIASYQWDWTSDGTYDATGATASHTYDASGEYTVTLRVTDDSGHTDTDSITVSVASSPSDDGGDGDDTDDGTGDGTGDFDGDDGSDEDDSSDDSDDESGNETGNETKPDDSGDEFRIITTTDGDSTTGSDRTLRVIVENAPAGSIVRLDSTTTDGRAVSATPNVIVSDLSIAMALATERGRLNVTIFAPDVASSDGETTPDAETVRQAAVAFEEMTGDVSAGYLYVEHDFAEEDLDSVQFNFSVRKAYLDGLGVEPDTVSLYRNDETGWSELDAEHVGSNGTHYRFESESPGFSVFAIASGAPAVVLSDTSLESDTVTLGEATSVTATVDNRGTIDGEVGLSLTADGEAVATESVVVAGGESADLTMSFEPAAAGEYELAVDGDPVGTVTVEEETADEVAVDDVDEPEDSAGSDGGTPLWLVGVLVVALIAILGGGVAYWRRD